jgi:predicted nuclease with TOPRIM domain
MTENYGMQCEPMGEDRIAQLEAENARMRERITLLENEGSKLVGRVNNLKLTFPGFATMFDAGTADMRSALKAGDE